MPRAYKSMLAFFQLVADVPGYVEFEQLQLGMDNKEAREVKWLAGDDGAANPGPSITVSRVEEAAD